NLRNAQNQDDPKALHDYFQPIVNKIRENGFTGIIWAPGTGWQANYTSYATYPIEGDNIGYAVHDYTGWYGCSDANPDPQNKIEQFHKQVPVVDTNPIIITEVDWSPENPSAQGHYNEHNEWVQPNYGTWSTGSTSKWGKAYKAMLDYYGNISMTLSGTGCLFDIDKLLSTGNVYPAFNGLEEACGKACMDWYAEYYTVNYPHADDEAETGDFYTIESLKADQESFDLMIGDKTKILLNVLYLDGHTKDISDVATYEVDQPSVVEVKNGSIRALANGEAQVQASYTDVQGTIWKKSFVVKVTGLDLGALTALSSLSDITDQPFAIVNKESQKMFYGPENQNLDMGDPLGVINNKSISGYMFKAEAISGRDGCYLLRLMTLNGSEYSVYGKPGYLNSQPTTGWCSFILGLNNQNGEDVKDGAVWEIKYESGKGFTLKNMATGKYLKDAAPAKYDAPAYFDFLKSSVTAGIHKVERSVDNDAVYTLQGIKIATLQQWDALPRGIYIVGGKKKLK
ncbi:MAG: cellulase family glycosylhydrolase, partial [Prevotella sp.]|nr:cellulase family glycosylhydrolase [Prevotella sp.]